MALAKELEAIADENWLAIVSGLVRLYDAAGFYHQMNAEIEKRLPYARRLGHVKSELSWRFRSLMAKAAFGTQPQQIIEQVGEMFTDHFGVMPASVRYQLGDRLCFIALMLDQPDLAKQVFHQYNHGAPERLEMGVLLGLHSGTLDQLPEHLPVRAFREFELFVNAALLRQPLSEPQMLRVIQEVLSPAFLHAGELLIVHAAFQLIQTRIMPRLQDRGIIGQIEEAMRQTMVGVMWWMHQRGMFAFMKPMVAGYPHLLTEQSTTTWGQRIQALEESYGRADDSEFPVTIDLPRLPDTILLADHALCIRQQPGADSLAVAKLGMLQAFVATDSEKHAILTPEFLLVVRKVGGLPSCTPGSSPSGRGRE